MDREAGDKKVQVRAEDVTNALCEVGVVKGDTVMFHSSLSSMGHVVGGADAVIAGFLDAVGPTGTVAVPTLCNWTPEEQHLVFERWDPATTPSFVGAITEGFRPAGRHRRAGRAAHSQARNGRSSPRALRPEGIRSRESMGALPAVGCCLLLPRGDVPGQHNGTLCGKPVG